MNNITSRPFRLNWSPVAACLLGAASMLASGCTAVSIFHQEAVSRPGMLFSDSAVLDLRSNLMGQIEPGIAVSGGGQAAGCTSCR